MKNRDFRISENSREEMTYTKPMFETSDKADKMYRQAQEVSLAYNNSHEHPLSAGKVYTTAVLHLIYQVVISTFLRGSDADPFSRIAVLAEKNKDTEEVLSFYDRMFPSLLKDPSILKRAWMSTPTKNDKTEGLLNDANTAVLKYCFDKMTFDKYKAEFETNNWKKVLDEINKKLGK